MMRRTPRSVPGGTSRPECTGTATVRPSANPAVFRKGSELESAKLFPLNNASRHLGMYDPKTQKYTTISTGFSANPV